MAESEADRMLRNQREWQANRPAEAIGAKRTGSNKTILIAISAFAGLILVAFAADEIQRRIDPVGHAARHARNDAARKANDAQLSANKAADDAKEQAQLAIDETKRRIEATAANEEREKGLHCLSTWDGSNRDTVDKLKEDLRNPSSFEHIETRILPNNNGKHLLMMKYRAENGFGGMNVESLVAEIDHETCKVLTISTGK